MTGGFKRCLTLPNVLSVVALFVALGGTALAVNAKTVGTRELKAAAVTTLKFRDDAVTGSKLNESTLGPVPVAASIPADSARGGSLAPVITVSNTVPTPPNTTSSATVQCPAGAVLLSGGGAVSDPALTSVLSRKSGENGWRFDGYSFSLSPQTITVYANCLSA